MTVREIIDTLVGVPGDVEVEVCDRNHIASSILSIEVTQSNGVTYVEATIDRKLVPDKSLAWAIEQGYTSSTGQPFDEPDAFRITPEGEEAIRAFAGSGSEGNG